MQPREATSPENFFLSLQTRMPLIETNLEGIHDSHEPGTGLDANSVESGAPTPSDTLNSARPALALPDRPSIAVLPFTNRSGDPDQEHFVEGISEDLITGLFRIRWLFVIARNSTFVYKHRAVDVKQVARQLGVRYVLEGSVRRFGMQLRISAQLVDAMTGGYHWAADGDRCGYC